MSAPSAPRYRNDAVFRSAQRLLATPPPRRPPARPSRWTVFLAGLVLGAILATSGWKYWREQLTQPVASARTFTGARPAPSATRGERRESNAATETLPAEPAAAATSPEEPLRDAREIPASRRVLAGSPFITPAEFATTLPDAARPPGEWTSSPVLTLTLSGELQSARAKPIECEFVLRRAADGKSRTVSGIIRFLSGEKRLAAYSLEGVFDDHTVRLHDSDKIWTLGDLTNPLLKPSTAGGGNQQFELHFPIDRDATEITGTWKMAGQSGTLSLHPALPW